MIEEVRTEKFILTLLRDKQLIARFLALIVILLAILLGATYSFIRVFRAALPPTSVQINEHGAYTLTLNNKRSVHWMFSSSELWANSGIPVEKGNKINITASGRFNTSINHLYEYSRDDSGFLFPWIDPDGLKPELEKHLLRASDKTRYPHRIATNDPDNEKIEVPIGKLLMQVFDKDKRPPDRPKKFYVIGQHREQVKIEEDGVLYFAVNEIPLDPSLKEVYVIRCDKGRPEDSAYCAQRSEALQEKAWADIERRSKLDSSAWNIWYTDNIGSIMLSIEVN